MENERTYYEEAKFYLDNAKSILKNSGVEEGLYTQTKYVVSAAGTAYAGVEKAAKWYIEKNGVKLKSDKVDNIEEALSKINNKMLTHFKSIYAGLHVDAYYQNMRNKASIQAYIDECYLFIKPLQIYPDKVIYVHRSPQKFKTSHLHKILRRSHIH